MEDPEWEPANVVEQQMADALIREDGQEYARLLRSSRLLIPALPEPGSPEESELAELLPPDTHYVPVFTSEESLVWAFGDLIREYEEVEFGALLQRWPNVHHQLAVNPGSPIATFLPPHAVADLAEGTQSLVAVDDVRQAIGEEALDQIRLICHAELSGAPVEQLPELREDPPANALERTLREAVDQSDGEAYLHALLAGDPVILPTTTVVADPDQIFEADFPWRVLGGDQAQVIPVFTSQELLARAGGQVADGPHLSVDFLHVLANWPDEDHLLYVDPGSVLELLLPGEIVFEVISSLAEAIDEQPDQPETSEEHDPPAAG